MFFWTVNMANIILIYISKANDWFTNMRYDSQNVCKGWNNIVASLQHLVMVKSSTSLTKNKWKLYVKWTKDNGSVSLKSHKKSSMDLHQNRHQHFKERTPDGFFLINNYLNYIKCDIITEEKHYQHYCLYRSKKWKQKETNSNSIFLFHSNSSSHLTVTANFNWNILTAFTKQ